MEGQKGRSSGNGGLVRGDFRRLVHEAYSVVVD